jgi:predicted nucleic acid-binding protein
VIVADASIIVKALTAEAGSHEALSVLEQADTVAAPMLVYAEVANVLRKKVRGRIISPAQFHESAKHLESAIDRIVPDIELLRDVVQLSETLDHSAYDCFYLAAALKTGSILVSADEVFLRKCADAGFAGAAMLPIVWLARN